MSGKVTRLLEAPMVRTVLLFAALFAIGLATRMPARMVPQLYALHGVLAAPFCAALALWHFRRGGSVLQLVAATGVLAVVLGLMSPAMGWGFAAVALMTLGVWAVVGLICPEARPFATAVAFGAVDYPCAVVVGIVLGTYGVSGESTLTVAVLLLLAVALAVFGACLVRDERA